MSVLLVRQNPSVHVALLATRIMTVDLAETHLKSINTKHFIRICYFIENSIVEVIYFNLAYFIIFTNY